MAAREYPESAENRSVLATPDTVHYDGAALGEPCS